MQLQHFEYYWYTSQYITSTTSVYCWTFTGILLDYYRYIANILYYYYISDYYRCIANILLLHQYTVRYTANILLLLCWQYTGNSPTVY